MKMRPLRLSGYKKFIIMKFSHGFPLVELWEVLELVSFIIFDVRRIIEMIV